MLAERVKPAHDRVAVKILQRVSANRRLRQEVLALSRCSHPHVVHFFSCYVTPLRVYTVMEYADVCFHFLSRVSNELIVRYEGA